MKTILIIEDDDNVRENISEILELNGYATYAAPNGKEGLKIALDLIPDLIVCDMMMPEMDGMEVLQHLREKHHMEHIPFIFLTARVEKKDFRQAMQIGADDYLTKPFDLRELLESIRRRLQRSEKLKKIIEEKSEAARSEIEITSHHELNTPVFGILGSTRVLKDYYEDLSESERLELIEAIYRSALRLESTLHQEALYGRILFLEQNPDEQKLFCRGLTENPGVLLNQVNNELQEFYQRQNQVIAEVDDKPVPINGENLKQILKELLSNAIKFSPVGSRIDVILSASERGLSLKVEDEGMGVDVKKLEKIYPFRQFHRDKQEQQGKGLGLYIVQKLVDFHHGTLQFASKAGGDGLVVSIQIPYL
jgi:signal transduction histidine kinase